MRFSIIRIDDNCFQARRQFCWNVGMALHEITCSSCGNSWWKISNHWVPKSSLGCFVPETSTTVGSRRCNWYWPKSSCSSEFESSHPANSSTSLNPMKRAGHGGLELSLPTTSFRPTSSSSSSLRRARTWPSRDLIGVVLMPSYPSP